MEPPSTVPFVSSSSTVERRKKVRQMLEEDEDGQGTLLLNISKRARLGIGEEIPLTDKHYVPDPSSSNRLTNQISSLTRSLSSSQGSPTKPRKTAISQKSPQSIKLRFAGRVYRTLSAGSPTSALKLYSKANGDFLGEPDELDDPEADDSQAAPQSIAPERVDDWTLSTSEAPSSDSADPVSENSLPGYYADTSSMPHSTPTKAPRNVSSTDLRPLTEKLSGHVKDIEKGSFSTKRSSHFTRRIQPSVFGYDPTSTLDPLTIPLPPHYASLLSLHASLERAFMLYLATDGSKAAGAISLATSTGASSATPSSTVPPNPIDRPDKLFDVKISNVVSLRTLRPIIERGAGKRFTQAELAKLCWLWTNNPTDHQIPHERGGSSRPRKGLKEVSGMGFLITSHSELDRSTGKKVSTYGIGITISIKQNDLAPSWQIADLPSTSNTPSPASSSHAGMSVMAIWSQGSEGRREEVRRRLGELVKRAHEEFLSRLQQRDLISDGRSEKMGKISKSDMDISSTEDLQHLFVTPRKERQATQSGVPGSSSRPPGGNDGKSQLVNGLPTPPSTSRRSKKSTSQPLFHPLFDLASLPPVNSSELPALSSYGLSTASGNVGKSPSKNTTKGRAPESHVELDVIGQHIPSSKEETSQDLLLGKTKISSDHVKAGSTKERAMSLLERIKAKEGMQNGPSLRNDLRSLSGTREHSLKSSTRSGRQAKAAEAERMTEFKRKSMLSRLPDVADAIFMLFAPQLGPVTPPSPSSSLPTPPTRRRRAIPLEEISTVVAKSSKVPLSNAEAGDAVSLLCTLCPGFANVKQIANQDWLVLATAQDCPSAGVDVVMSLKDVKERIRTELLG